MKIEAYAKVNFTLEVFPEREDGYHSLRSLVVPISLSDTLDITLRDDAEIHTDSPYKDDLALKAALALRASRFVQSESPGVDIKIVKRIPAGGGLGGGSADAAATLIALNELWALNLPREALAELATTIGSDVPSLVMGNSVIMEGRGEKVTPFGDFPQLSLVLLNPGIFSSTKEVYQKCTPRVTNDPKILYNIRQAVQGGSLSDIANALMNDLQEPAIALHPEIASSMDLLRSLGVEKPLMTGSGSTVFGLVSNEDEGRKIANLLTSKGHKAWFVKSVVR